MTLYRSIALIFIFLVSFSSNEDQAFAVCVLDNGHIKEFKIEDLEMVGYVPINNTLKYTL